MTRRILRIALPSIAQNVTIPLLGLADAAISGHLGGAHYIGAVAVGSMIFNMLYWLCAFLRMSIGGHTAQAVGRGDAEAVTRLLQGSLRTALLIALAFILLQKPLGDFSFWLMDATPEVERLARAYYYILIWGAPAVLASYCFAGWHLGRQNARLPMVVAIVQNVMNIAFSLFFVLVLGMKVEGIALGTLLAQWGGIIMYLAPSNLPQGGDLQSRRREFASNIWEQIKHLPRQLAALKASPLGGTEGGPAGADAFLFLRTLCMVAVQVFFTKWGAAQGETVLAVNALLMQYYLLFSYVMDGFAYAGEAVGGMLYGAADRTGFRRLTRELFLWGCLLTALFSLFYGFGGEAFLTLLTDDAAVVQAARPYLFYACLLPVCGMATFLFDGLCIGATRFPLMLLSVALGAVAFFLLASFLPLLFPSLGTNVALWCAMLSFLALRGAVQACGFRTLLPR